MNGPFFTDLAIVFRSLVSGFWFLVSGWCWSENQKPQTRNQKLLFPSTHDEPIRALVVPGLIPACRLAPRRNRVPAAGGFTFAAAVRMINRIHRDAAHLWPASLPSRASGLAQRNIAVLDVTDLSYGRVAIYVDAANLTARQSKLRPVAFLGHKLRRSARRANHLRAFARPQFYVVNRRAQRNRLERKRVARNYVSLGSRYDGLPDLQANRRDDVTLLAVYIT